ncbi:MAG: hypothetical protein ACC645_18200 [Pirellulales bacterium]
MFRKLRNLTCLFCFAIQFPLGCAVAQERASWSLDASQHKWAKFFPGAWSKVRVATDSVAPGGTVAHTSLTYRTTTLVAVEPNRYSLKTVTTVEVAGKRMEAKPQIVAYDLLDNLASQETVLREGGTANLIIQQHSVPCHLYLTEASTAARKDFTTLYYSAEIAPYILKRQSRATDAASDATIEETVEEVHQLQVRRRVLGRRMWTSHVEIRRTHAKGSSVADAFWSLEVPGAVVESVMTESDSDGHVIRRRTLELMGYGFTAPRRHIRSRHGRRRR